MRRTYLEQLASLGALFAAIAAAAEQPRPRGVGPEFAKFYKQSDKTFQCISNPSINLDISQLNDDYCDCPDGSDEPGTSACSQLSSLSPPVPVDAASATYNTTAALPGFYCKNKGHQPTYIPFTYVNDGICDYELCCDGSDEWQGVGGVKCEDKCKEIGKEWRKHHEARQKSLGTANKKRRELITESARLRKQVEDRLQTLQTEIEGAEIKVNGLKKELAEIERQERGKVVKGPTAPGKLGILANLAKERITELKDSLTRVRGERESLKGRVKELEEILSTFKEEYNPNFNDEGVKRTVKRWEDYAAKDKGGESDAALDRDVDEILKPDEENGLVWADYEGAEETDVDVLYKFEEYLPQPVRDWVDQKLRDLRVMLIDNGILAGAPSDGSESTAVTDARNRLSSAESELTNHQNELQGHKDDLEKDYGPSEVFRALKDQCVEVDSGEYTYEFCFMDKTTQKSKKGHGNTNMGNFVRIEKIMVDDELPADGRGLGSGERYAMKFENGQHCWNGPNRSTLVVLACAEKDEVWKVTEEEKCVYRMEVGTPAVCETAANGGHKKDEL